MKKSIFNILICIFLISLSSVYASTNFIIGGNNSEGVSVDKQFPNDNQAASGSINDLKIADCGTGDSVRARSYIRFFNLTNITSGSTINEAYLNLFYRSADITENVVLYGINDQTWDENVITWNNQPCSTTAGVYTPCNSTPIANVSVNANLEYKKWNITNAVQRAFDNGNNLSMLLAVSDEAACDDRTNFYRSRRWTNSSQYPYLNITYSASTTSNETPPQLTYDPIAVHLNGTEIIGGFKTFLSNTIFSLATFTDITVSNIFGGNFFGNKIQANNLTVVDTVNSSKINANAITAASISANTITTNNLNFTGSFASNLSQSVGLPIAVLSQTSPALPIKKDFNSNGETWIWWGKGAIKGANAARTVSLKLDNVEQDGVITKQASAADSVPFSLMFTKVIPSGLHSVNITTTGGTLQNLSLIGMGIK